MIQSNLILYLFFLSSEYLPFPESIISEHYSSLHLNKYDLSKNLQEKLGVSERNRISVNNLYI